MKKFIIALSFLVVISSFILGFHNANLYNPKHGFDGEAHVYYIKYLYQNKSLPTPGWEISGIYGETHQPPLYYAIGALLFSVTKNIKSVQYINIFILWLIIGMVGLGLRKIFKNKDQVLVGIFSLAALPMLNIFPAMVSNELLNTLWVVSSVVSLLFLITAKNNRQLIFYLIWLTASFILGIWTKVSIFSIIPAILTAFVLIILKKKLPQKKIFLSLSLTVILIGIFSLPIIIRNQTRPNASNIVNMVLAKKSFRSLDYYFRLDWIYKADMYNTQYYSLIGAAWNSFWTDGHNAITPFVKFHKKSFILWSLGFILLPLSLYGLVLLYKKNKQSAAILYTVGITMLGVYVFTNLNNHYSAARLTYEMGIVVPYAFGIAAAFRQKKIKILLLFILTVQYVTMVSFYWILPWWHVTR